jgi:CO dehydrogenase/acetyl-CoA synthase delta subunit
MPNEQALMCPKRHFVDVIDVHEYMVVARPQIKLGEESHAMKFIQELLRNWNRKLILGGPAVKSSVVDAEMPGVVCLLDQEHRGRERGGACTCMA